MIKNIFKICFILLFTLQVSAQQKNHWLKTGEAKIINSQSQKESNLKNYQIFDLNIQALKNNLVKVPKKNTDLNKSTFIMQFPDATGKMIPFLIKEYPVMHPDLAERYPNNKSYKGVSVNDKSLRIRFSVNEKGLHAMLVNKNREVQYIDPIANNKTSYKIYRRKDLSLNDAAFACFTKSEVNVKRVNLSKQATNDRKLRTYRMAMASTGEYSQYHIALAGAGGSTDAQKKAVVLSEMTTLITRMNDLYENDLAVTFQLVANNDALIFLDAATDPYTNDDGIAMLSENQTTCTNVMGTANYDIGHVLSTGGGGVASFASICSSSVKARGVTGSPNPIGDTFYYDYVAHEIGHQFGANHTFNGDAGNCGGGNRNNATAVEPGSGTTIMAYAGICSPQNVQANSDAYFHIVSIDEMWFNITIGSGTCGAQTNLNTNLFVPTANAGNDFVLPKGTPYKLEGQGNDGDNDPISFSWEQIDNEITAIPPSETATAGALYRSVNPKGVGTRYLPELSTVVAGNISSTWEVTPNVAREMNFKLTVRDNNVEAGQIVSDILNVQVTNTAGPFVVTSQNTSDLVWDKDTTQNITWDIAGTTANSINVSNVNILLSTNGGLTFDTVLLSNTPNDGTQNITVPDVLASKCYIMVEAVNHFFYAINATTFSIGEFVEVCDNYAAVNTPVSIPDNTPAGVTNTVTVSDNITLESVKISVKISHTWVSDLTLTLESPNGTIIELLSGACSNEENIDVIFDDSGSNLSCATTVPTLSGNIKPSESLSNFSGENSLGVWRLKVVDGEAQDVGIIESWSLELCTSEPVLAINNHELSSFNIYPNPSSGFLNIEFTSKNTENTEITLFDLLGRKIINKTYYNNEATFKETIDISSVSSGLYVLYVKNGNQISSKKVQIK